MLNFTFFLASFQQYFPLEPQRFHQSFIQHSPCLSIVAVWVLALHSWPVGWSKVLSCPSWKFMNWFWIRFCLSPIVELVLSWTGHESCFIRFFSMVFSPISAWIHGEASHNFGQRVETTSRGIHSFLGHNPIKSHQIPSNPSQVPTSRPSSTRGSAAWRGRRAWDWRRPEAMHHTWWVLDLQQRHMGSTGNGASHGRWTFPNLGVP